MDVRQLEYFVLAGHSGSFARAAQRAHIGRAALSQQIRQLETELGLELFIRTAHAVELSEDGAALLRTAGRVLTRRDELAVFARRVAAGQSGTVRIGWPSHGLGVLAAQVSRALSEHLPEVNVRMQRVCWSDPTGPLLAGRLDAVFLRRSDVVAGTVAGGVCQAEPRVLALSARDPLAALKDVALQDVPADRPLLGCGRPDATGDLWGPWPADLVTGRLVIATGDAASLVTRIAAGEGVALVPQGFAAQYRHPGFVLRPFLDAPASFVRPVWRADDDNPALAAVIDRIASACSTQPEAGGQRHIA